MNNAFNKLKFVVYVFFLLHCLSCALMLVEFPEMTSCWKQNCRSNVIQVQISGYGSLLWMYWLFEAAHVCISSQEGFEMLYSLSFHETDVPWYFCRLSVQTATLPQSTSISVHPKKLIHHRLASTIRRAMLIATTVFVHELMVSTTIIVVKTSNKEKGLPTAQSTEQSIRQNSLKALSFREWLLVPFAKTHAGKVKPLHVSSWCVMTKVLIHSLILHQVNRHIDFFQLFQLVSSEWSSCPILVQVQAEFLQSVTRRFQSSGKPPSIDLLELRQVVQVNSKECSQACNEPSGWNVSFLCSPLTQTSQQPWMWLALCWPFILIQLLHVPFEMEPLHKKHLEVVGALSMAKPLIRCGKDGKLSGATRPKIVSPHLFST